MCISNSMATVRHEFRVLPIVFVFFIAVESDCAAKGKPGLSYVPEVQRGELSKRA